ncbi:MAG: prepilin peptidase [Alphaproteobacteria bacterium]|nr:prepilin peptidase [Alphaproteobacteria bacterium]
MVLPLHLCALAGFAGVMIAAALEDFRRLIIPNTLIVALCLLWPLYLAGAPSLAGILAALGCAAVIFILGAVCFAWGYIGGGDVKLLTAAILWAGPAGAPALLAVTGLLGGLLALVLLTPVGAQAAQAGRLLLGGADLPAPGAAPIQVPYGVAIAAAALIVIVPPNFS